MRLTLVNTNLMRPLIAPIGLEYVAEATRAAGHEVALLDLAFADDIPGAVERHLRTADADLVGVTLRNTDECFFPNQASFVPRLADIVQAIRQHSAAPVVLGGIGFSMLARPVLDAVAADYGIVGDGEEALPALLDALAGMRDLASVPGLTGRGSGDRQRAPARANLDGLPAFRRDVLDHARYFREGGQGGFEAKRGCDRGCIYCAEPYVKGRRIRLRDPAKVGDEVEALLAQGVTHWHTCDSEFNLPPQHALAVCEEFARRGVGDRARWYAYCTVAPFDRDLARAMRRAGCVGVDFGADGGCDEQLQRLGRDYGAAEVAETARICREEGLVFMYDLLLAAPGETRETLRETITLMERLDPDRVGVSCGVRVYPNTRLAESVRAQGPLGRIPGVHGCVEGNDRLLHPVFYVSPGLGDDFGDYLERLIGGDERFLFANPAKAEQNYNYSDNQLLVEAVRAGERGAYWDILRRLKQR